MPSVVISSSIRFLRLLQLQSGFNLPSHHRSFAKNLARTAPKKEIDPDVKWSSPLPKQTPSDAPNDAKEAADAKVFTYLVVAPDLGNSKRAILRAEHFKMAQEGLKTGRIVNAGAMLESDASESNNFDPKMIGEIHFFLLNHLSFHLFY
ncbi:hypothetical protein PGTUg99_011293 [Puccinia graminis f. sp. tritici]|uniref:Uncharacterized protein n=1 Tax=Puccinia graminis f. sp. tritici TaxID=56615 RepID=A0A5B0SA27_PUCGR|nr:hypothetical protein PGTUg99_011293 [Puccinia graminis f. sp. tritici]